jgi:hypothetical protein
MTRTDHPSIDSVGSVRLEHELDQIAAIGVACGHRMHNRMRDA